jgi:hypothetical protein
MSSFKLNPRTTISKVSQIAVRLRKWISHRLSAIGYRLSAISYQLSAIGFRPALLLNPCWFNLGPGINSDVSAQRSFKIPALGN